jgi:hypothetical protein
MSNTSLQNVLSAIYKIENNVQNILKDIRRINEVIEQELRVNGEQTVAKRIMDSWTEVETIIYEPTTLFLLLGIKYGALNYHLV